MTLGKLRATFSPYQPTGVTDMPVKPFWAAFRALLESAGCDITPISQKPGEFVKPVIVVRFGGAVAADVGAAIIPAFALPADADPFFSDRRSAAIKRVSKTLKGRGVGEWYSYGGYMGLKRGWHVTRFSRRTPYGSIWSSAERFCATVSRQTMPWENSCELLTTT